MWLQVSWLDIAATLKHEFKQHRTPVEVMEYWQRTYNTQLQSTGKWTKEEDAILHEVLHCIHTRTRMQCILLLLDVSFCMRAQACARTHSRTHTARTQQVAADTASHTTSCSSLCG